ncbi:MAG: ExbD/TolR family protein [Akkermansiaceae bacterium]
MEFHRPSRTIPQVPIIPLIDILAILLIYFAVAYDPKDKRPVLHIALPLAQDSAVTQVVEPAAVLAIAENGEITLDATRIHEGMLVSYLEVFRKQFPNRKLEIEADKKIPLERFIQIQNVLIKAGFDPSQVPTRVKLPNNTPTE